MAKIVSVGTSVPEHKITQQEARCFSEYLFGSALPDIDQYLKIFDNTTIQERYVSKPKEWFMSERSFSERNDAYIEVASDLGEKAVLRCLEKANVNPKDIDSFFFVSTSGLATPSIDARLINRLGMGTHTKRTPIWGLGCAGGVAGLSRAAEIARAFPNKYILLLTVELCSLTFRKEDFSKSNFVATSLFSDGAAAVLLAGDEVQLEGDSPYIVSSMSTLWPNSLDVMGWEIVDDGLKVVFSKEIPNIVSMGLEQALIHVLGRNQLKLTNISHFILHPGGMKVVEAYQHALGISVEKLQHTASILKSYGNMSSSTVLFVLEKELQDPHESDSYGLMMALGPGFSLESTILRWE